MVGWDGQENRVLSSPRLLRLEMAVHGATPFPFSVLVSLALREEFEHR